MPNAGGGEEKKRKTEEKMEEQRCGGYEGKGTVQGRCGQEREEEDSEEQKPLTTSDKLKRNKK